MPSPMEFAQKTGSIPPVTYNFIADVRGAKRRGAHTRSLGYEDLRESTKKPTVATGMHHSARPP